MKPRSFRLALVVASLYTVIAAVVSLWDLFSPAPPGAWLVLRGIGVCIVTLPACYIVENVFPALGIPSPNFYDIRESPYTVIALIVMILSCAALIYSITAWIQKRIRSRTIKTRRPRSGHPS
ncbi:MAG TPA: hypothetical protein VLJ37_05420 [bacterium]|nr:hypothetical protein [bacterium]